MGKNDYIREGDDCPFCLSFKDSYTIGTLEHYHEKTLWCPECKSTYMAYEAKKEEKKEGIGENLVDASLNILEGFIDILGD